MRAKKKLGQHFLSNKNILELMCSAAEITGENTVLEAGPGLGTLTEILAERAKKVIAVEKDRDLIPFLKEKFRNKKNVEIVEGDILAVSPPLGGLTAKSYKIVANIPYYITSHFLRLFLSETKFKPKLMVLMIQKDVAERIMARDGKPACRQGRESLLSLSVKAYGRPEIVKIVPRGAFSPPPKVDSAIIKITPFYSPLKVRGARGVMKIDPEKILSLARLAFQKKRKMLRQSIGKKVNLPPQYETSRPEELSLEDWLKILKSC
ncbi:ribosomal RNA small subunit methyltransferase A [Candidatus Giovannonibacteria bacterium RIFCSPHIGHO2_01_FULL_45_33]|uniref:Ribosomal RNA small subunit methyltransferase A n=1 Tax=Candidatus Giovannonibacteria bacterium RIFCSPLOWO2_01_FULL_45_34 TaxID=1798351 RepID=A0A1F5WY55_9BACT|nr:MAG: ribosomal RNA small subunit methyltransferase A [Candidatus Giovannonibacteria bacterium RIFCSPHIGHO2_01_FULL_45_33]OGF70870.1 MAG: ribosomal RNA small subunit methyltransferase A [Candidatus Giovannonibacteria bacterium RIFCSPHIGHO2_02_FULL_44_11]OGF80533.1 MAG: ribosomal RNA small subunit methyltransferase A [Candidatus Giovannonibacteria bacterium RIFCSPLOWO2_01_FULL_45_34]